MFSLAMDLRHFGTTIQPKAPIPLPMNSAAPRGTDDDKQAAYNPVEPLLDGLHLTIKTPYAVGTKRQHPSYYQYGQSGCHSKHHGQQPAAADRGRQRNEHPEIEDGA